MKFLQNYVYQLINWIYTFIRTKTGRNPHSTPTPCDVHSCVGEEKLHTENPDSGEETLLKTHSQEDYTHGSKTLNGSKPQQPDEDQYFTTKPHVYIPQTDIVLHSGKPELREQCENDEDSPGNAQALPELFTDYVGPNYASLDSSELLYSSLSDGSKQGGQSASDSGGGGSQDSGGGGSGQAGGGSNGDGGASGGRGGNSGGGSDGGDDGRKPPHSHNTDDAVASTDISDEDESDGEHMPGTTVQQEAGDQKQGTGPDGGLILQSVEALRCETCGPNQLTPSAPSAQSRVATSLEKISGEGQDHPAGAAYQIPVQCSEEATRLENLLYCTPDLEGNDQGNAGDQASIARRPTVQLRDGITFTDGCDGEELPVAAGGVNATYSLQHEPSEIVPRNGVTILAKCEGEEESDGPGTPDEDLDIQIMQMIQIQRQQHIRTLGLARRILQARRGNDRVSDERTENETSLEPSKPPVRAVDGLAASGQVNLSHHLSRPPEASVQEGATGASSDNPVGERSRAESLILAQKLPTSPVLSLATTGRSQGQDGRVRDRGKPQRSLCHLCETYLSQEQLCPCGHSLCRWCARRYLGELSEYQVGKQPREPCPHCGTLIQHRLPV